MENIAEKCGQRIAECRRQKGFTQDDLANRIGVTPQALSKWEKGISSPDLSMLSSLCDILEVSSEYLLGKYNKNINENGNQIVQSEIWNNLRQGLEPLELIWGENIARIFAKNDFMDKIMNLRLRLSREGILMPIMSVKDQSLLKTNEFMILSYQNVLYSEKVEVNGNIIEYILGKLEDTVRSKYAEILNVDILQDIINNLRVKYPVLVDEISANNISIGLILDVVKAFINRGNGMIYLPKIIEVILREKREKDNITTTELAEKVCNELERKDNFWVIMGTR